MSGRTRVVLCAAVCALGWIGTQAALAQDQSPPGSATAPSTPANQPPPPPKPLMSLLDQTPVGKPLDDAGISVFGFVEGSYTYNFQTPPGNVNTGRVFDLDNETPEMNQLDLTVQRSVDATKKSPDIGFTFEGIYGTDGRFIHANGLDFYGPGDAAKGPQMSPDYQADIVQAYVDFVPAQNWLIRAGKMVTHMGFETINPTTNPLFSHSYLFGYAIPFTHTGVMAYYTVNDKLTLMGGFSRGWEQSLKDNNGDAIDGLGQVKYQFTDKLTGYFNYTVGPEKAGNTDDYRIVLDTILQYQLTDAWSVAVNGDWGWEQHSAAGGGDAQWYGVAGYVGYKINDMFTLNGRGEWFDDPDNARGLGTGVYEVTGGVTITPFPSNSLASNLKIRPELRYDYAEKDVFDGGRVPYQLSAGVDAIFTY